MGATANQPPSLDVQSVVTLASLVEKETGKAGSERKWHRCSRTGCATNMPLQCDPTAIYAALLEDRYRGTIFKSDLESRNAYNTYQHPGLPPGPITNPGTASLEAALQPAATDYLYFVAKPDGSGTHNFSAAIQSTSATCRLTVMARPKRTRAAEIRAAIEVRGFTSIADAEWNELRAAFPNASDTTVRHAVRESGVPLDALVDGVRLSAFDQFEQSFAALVAEYDRACRDGDSARARRCREVAIRAKDHARMAARAARDKDRSEEKAEMVEWLLVWLETPDLFESWAGLRQRAKRAG